MTKKTDFNIENKKNKSGSQGVWWHKENIGPLKNLSFIKHFGSMKFSKVNMDKNMLPHLNDGIEIHFVHSGKYNWVIEDKKIELLTDNLSVSAPWHLNGSPTGKMDIGKINWLVIKPKIFTLTEPLDLGTWTKLPHAFQESLGNLIAHDKNFVIEKAKTFKKYFIELEKELTNQNEGYEVMVGNIIENLLIDLHRHLSLKQQQDIEEDNFTNKLTQIILADLNKKWIIDDLAYMFGMGKTKFTYEVKKLTGYPPNSFIIQLKIQKAIDLIEEGSMKMSDIAFACGFSSLQHFTATFSQRIGVSPSRYGR
ncbi:MAG: helix-turn-helix domain-containing protein [Flavobacteriaceae bacterium]